MPSRRSCLARGQVSLAFLDGLAFDPFSFQQDGLTAPEVDVGRSEPCFNRLALEGMQIRGATPCRAVK
jgi:hypothetical protein